MVEVSIDTPKKKALGRKNLSEFSGALGPVKV